MTTQITRRFRRPFVLLAVQCGAIGVGSVLLLVGVLGFVPGSTTNVSAAPMVQSYRPPPNDAEIDEMAPSTRKSSPVRTFGQ